MSYRIVEIAASSFRGFAELHIPFDPGLTVIAGPNGSGKSSTINAVAWALAGKAIAQKRIGVVEIPERKGWQVVRDGEKSCVVSLFLLDGRRELRVRRSSVRDQCEVKGASSGGDPLAALDLTLDTFLSSIFLPQELLRIPVALDPRERGRIFLDLVGLGTLGELEGTLGECAKAAKAAADEIGGLRKSLDDLIAGQVSVKRRDIGELREKARRDGFGADLDAPDAVERFVRTCRSALAGLCERHGAPAPTVAEVGSHEDLTAFVKGVREALRRFEASSPDLVRKTELDRRRYAISDLQQERERLAAERRALDAEKDALAALGTEEALLARKASQEEELRQVKEEIARASMQGKLLGEALTYFQGLVPGPEPLACPVCETRPIDLARVRAHLERSLERAGVEPLRRKLVELERSLQETQGLLARHARRREAWDALQARIEAFRGRVGDLRGQAVTAGEDTARVLAAMLDAVQRDLDGIAARIEERGRDVQRVRDELDRLEVLQRVQEGVRALDRLDRLPMEPSYLDLKEQEYRSHLLLGVAEELRAALKEERRRAFNEAFSAVQEDVVRVFRRITDRPECRSLRIDSEKWSLLEETDRGEREVTATFNVGDLTSVALAIFLATATRAAHQAGFVLLDDPTQGLDDDHKRRLAGVLGEMAAHRQVVVASADKVFVAALEGAGTASRVFHRLRDRAAGRACEVAS